MTLEELLRAVYGKIEVANAYGVEGEAGEPYYTHWHFPREPRVSTIVLETSKDHLVPSRAARAAFSALCRDEILVPFEPRTYHIVTISP